ncbi:MAG: hypothetical protein WBD47_16020, partial [Phormidesmis sp.]
YSVDEIPLESPEPISRTSNVTAEPAFSTDIAARLESLRDAPDAVRYSEIKDLGRSFRSYYLRLTLENADIDLPFIPSSIKQSLAVLIRRSKVSARQAEDQILHLKSEVEDWYDRSMERASGVYRRNAKGISILIGISLAIAVNANSIHILDQLAFDNELRHSMVGSIQRSIENSETLDREVLLSDLEKSLDEINLPIGWDPHLINEEFDCNLSKPPADTLTGGEEPPELWHQVIQACIYSPQSAANPTANSADPPKAFFYPTAIASIFLQQPLVGLRYLLGWIITGIAISMGASFWFDLLGKLIKVRNTGRPLPTSSKVLDRKDAPTAAAIKDE